eukprot:scaffold32981_cov66-Phaeocystis_antarctica.AAC.9
MRSPPPSCHSHEQTFHSGALDVEAQGIFKRRAHIRSPSRDVQPDQLNPASGRDIHDPPLSLSDEHDAPGHLRLDGHFAVDAER